MTIDLTVRRLNSLCKKLNDDGVAPNIDNRIKFYYGENFDSVADILFSLTPMAKILVLSTQNTFENKAQSVLDALKGKNLKPISIIANGNGLVDVDEACGIFATNDDVRAVLVLDSQLFATAFYFCAVRNLPCALVVSGLINRGIFSRKLLIKNGNEIDTFECDIDRHVFIIKNEKKVNEQDVATAFSFQTACLVALTDYRLYSAVTRETPFKSAYNLARTAILDTFNLIKDKNGIKDKLFYNGMVIELADYLTFGRLISFSAPALSEYIYSLNGSGDGVALASACVIMQTYSKFVSCDGAELTFAPNYIERAKRLNELVGFTEEDVLKSYRTQSNLFSARKVKINEYRQKLKEEIFGAERALALAMKEYFALNGSNNVDLNLLYESVKLSGDTPLTINGMSLAREWGIIKEN